MSGNETSSQSCFLNLNHESPTSPLDLSTTGPYRPFLLSPISNDNLWSLPLDLSVKTNYMINRQMSVSNLYEEPEIITEPKSDWHYRSIKDLSKRHIPLLSGDGPQRTPIRVQVSFSL